MMYLPFFLSCSVQEAHSIMTFVLSRNGRHALLNVATQVLSNAVHSVISCNVIPSLLPNFSVLYFVAWGNGPRKSYW